MPADAIALPSRAPARAAEISQATAVEQARAAAEVQAAVVVAQNVPRDMDRARTQMLHACESFPLAERAFYSVPNRGQGPSVHLARELARCFGNIQHGIIEMRRDDVAGMSEVQAFAWDVENNTRSVRSFMVPHQRMKGRERQPLIDLTDIVNNNNNAGSRAVRETIFTVLPVDFVEAAKAACRVTLERGNGTPLAERITNMVSAYGRRGVTEQQLATKVGKPSAQWNEQDVAGLTVVWQSLNAGDTTKDDEFPPAERRVTTDELVGGTTDGGGEGSREATPVAGGEAGSSPAGNPSPPSQHTAGSITPEQLTKLHTMLGKVGLDDRNEGLAYYARVTGVVVASSKDLSRWEANQVIEDLQRVERGERNALDPADAVDPSDEPDWGNQS
jgi:hypothetical protein